ncbi:ParB/RepB/Spo0J family partition protein [Palleronia sp.]|uniref:ParB/RepB/Spo0J family partition protein n=1 Tax=Palleronia sp. TaxID=1940284 RepID=UPI0035C86382
MARRKRLTLPTPLPDALDRVSEIRATGQGDFSAAPAAPGAGQVSAAPAAPGAGQVSVAPVARVAQDQAQAAALRELSEEMTRAREGGRIVLELPIDAIEAEHLIRDRLSADETEMHSLKESLVASGQRNPIEVLDLGGGRYGLISGWRRLTALRALSCEGRVEGKVLALLRRPEDQAAAYRAMVEENEIRADLSYYERARIVAKAVEAGIFEDDRAALQGLFGAASRPRRSKIGSFLPIVRALDGALRYPSALPERLGLKLSQCLREDDALAGQLREALERGAETLEAERTCLEKAVAPPRPFRSAPSDAGAGQEVPHVAVTRDGQGRLVLQGAGVTDDFVARLKTWIKRGAKSD